MRYAGLSNSGVRHKYRATRERRTRPCLSWDERRKNVRSAVVRLSTDFIGSGNMAGVYWIKMDSKKASIEINSPADRPNHPVVVTALVILFLVVVMVWYASQQEQGVTQNDVDRFIKKSYETADSGRGLTAQEMAKFNQGISGQTEAIAPIPSDDSAGETKN